MATNIILKKSSVASNAPTTGQLQFGEIALNYADGVLYYKDNGSNIKRFIDSDNLVSKFAQLANIGTIASQNSNNVTITGGSITGITDLAVADGGTGASTATAARTNLGLGSMAVQNSGSVTITGGSITGITDLAIADGGTGASTATAARTSLGLAIGTNVQAWNSNLDTYVNNALTSNELTQLQNIDATTISIAQWGYLGAASTFGGSLIDDADAAAARSTLGLATVASSGDYNDLINKPATSGFTKDSADTLYLSLTGGTITDTSGVTVPLTINGATGASSLVLQNNGSTAALFSATGNLLTGDRTSGVPGDVGAAVRANGIGEFVRAAHGRAHLNLNDSAVAEFISASAGIVPLQIRSAAGQTVPLIVGYDSSSTELFTINNVGGFRAGPASPYTSSTNYSTAVAPGYIGARREGYGFTQINTGAGLIDISVSDSSKIGVVVRETGIGDQPLFAALDSVGGARWTLGNSDWRMGDMATGDPLDEFLMGTRIRHFGMAYLNRVGFGYAHYNVANRGAVQYLECEDGTRVISKLKTAPNQSANTLEIRDSADQLLSYFNKNGTWFLSRTGDFYGGSLINLTSLGPTIDMIEVDAPTTHNMAKIRNVGGKFQIRGADQNGTQVGAEAYAITWGSSGASQHTWALNSTNVADIGDSGFEVIGAVRAQREALDGTQYVEIFSNPTAHYVYGRSPIGNPKALLIRNDQSNIQLRTDTSQPIQFYTNNTLRGSWASDGEFQADAGAKILGSVVGEYTNRSSLTGAVSIDTATHGCIQYWSLSGNITVTDDMVTGEVMTLAIDLNGNTVTWPTMTWEYLGGTTAPTGFTRMWVTFYRLASNIQGVVAHVR